MPKVCAAGVFSQETIQHIRIAHKTLYKSKLPLAKAQEELVEMGKICNEVASIERFISQSRRSIVR